MKVTTTSVEPTTTVITTLKPETTADSQVKNQMSVCPWNTDVFNGEKYHADCPGSNMCTSKNIGTCGYSLITSLHDQLCKPHTAQTIMLAISFELNYIGEFYEKETGDICDNNLEPTAVLKSAKISPKFTVNLAFRI